MKSCDRCNLRKVTFFDSVREEDLFHSSPLGKLKQILVTIIVGVISFAGTQGQAYANEYCGNFKEAFNEYRALADKGESKAMGKVAEAYLLGKGIRPDNQEAIIWAKKAAELGDPLGQRLLGNLYLRGDHPDTQRGLELIKLAAKQGDVVAFFSLGSIYRGSIKAIPSDTKELARWKESVADVIERASTSNDPKVLTTLGGAYYDGAGVGRNGSKAMEYFLKAAEAGYPEAMVIYANGIGMGRDVPRNDKGESIKWGERAVDCLTNEATSADFYAMRSLADVHGSLTFGGKKGYNEDASKKWYGELVSRYDDDISMLQLGYFYYRPDGIVYGENRPEAKKWFQRAVAKDGTAATAALYALGSMAKDSKNYAEATQMFKLAADKGSEAAGKELLAIAATKQIAESKAAEAKMAAENARKQELAKRQAPKSIGQKICSISSGEQKEIVAYAFGKPVYGVSRGTRYLTTGFVEALSGDKIKILIGGIMANSVASPDAFTVTIDRLNGDVIYENGKAIWDSAVNWYPC